MCKNSTDRIIVVDDHMIVGEVAQETLKEAGFENVLFFENPRKALEDVRTHKRPALILTDYQMPELNGLELLKKIEEYHPVINAIIMTAEPTMFADQPHRFPILVKKDDFSEKLTEIARDLLEKTSR
jgi:CheY-like chemotaxis protein